MEGLTYCIEFGSCTGVGADADTGVDADADADYSNKTLLRWRR